jgi:archaellum component FlaC
MPCYARTKRQFQILKEEISEMRKSGEIPYEKQQEKQRAIEDLYAKLKEKYDSHSKELDRLKRKLKEATSAWEKEQLEKEIAELEGELEGMHNSMQELIDFMRDIERRTISVPTKTDDQQESEK